MLTTMNKENKEKSNLLLDVHGLLIKYSLLVADLLILVKLP